VRCLRSPIISNVIHAIHTPPTSPFQMRAAVALGQTRGVVARCLLCSVARGASEQARPRLGEDARGLRNGVLQCDATLLQLARSKLQQIRKCPTSISRSPPVPDKYEVHSPRSTRARLALWLANKAEAVASHADRWHAVACLDRYQIDRVFVD